MNATEPTFYNPYIAGPPITDPGMFFGRQADLEKILNLLHGGNFVMLVGPRRIGKTSLLHQLRGRLATSENEGKQFVPVLVSVEGTHQAEFFHAVMEDIIDLTADHLPVNFISHLSFDLAISNYSARLFARDLHLILSNLQKAQPKPCHLILLLDEMDTFTNYDLATQAQFRRILQRFVHYNLSVVTAGVNLQRQWAGESSPFFNMFIPVPLAPFDQAEARRLIVEPVAGIYHYRDEAINRILEATSGLPHRIQQLCLETIYYLPASPKVTPEITAKLVDKALAEIAWLDEEIREKDEAQRISEFMSIVSHELRTPIVAIKGYTELLRMTTGPFTDRQIQFLDSISRAADQITTLLNDLLYVSRIDTGRLHLNLQEVRVADLIDEVTEAFRNQIEQKQLTLKIVIANDLPQLHIDYQRMVQALANLISNACKYTSPGGSVTINAITCTDEEISGICLTVADTGHGIAEEDQAQLFTRFFRSHDEQIRSTEGTGLGLTITKTIVDAHRGKLTVESELGKGSAFTIFLPL